MRNAIRDRITGVVLIIAAALWFWATIVTIPVADDPGRLGSRGFPLGLSVLLAVLGGVQIVMSLRPAGPPQPRSAEEAGPTPLSLELWGVVMTLLLIIGYAVAMEQFGFLIATLAVIVLAVGAVLGLYKQPVLIVGLALGMALGIYFVFGKLLGVYLPHGQLLDLVF